MTNCTYKNCNRATKGGSRFCPAHKRRDWLGLDMDAPIRKYRGRGASLERNTNDEKYCARCETWKAEDEFHADAKTADKHRHACKHCDYIYNLERVYNLDERRYNKMLTEQNGVCGICKKSGKLVVDHDHKCCPGKSSCGECVRGLLCNNCNTRIGWLETNDVAIYKYLKD